MSTQEPTQHERDKLESAVTDALMEWHGDASGTQHVTEYVLAAGFRRVEVTDPIHAVRKAVTLALAFTPWPVAGEEYDATQLIEALVRELSAALGEETP